MNHQNSNPYPVIRDNMDAVSRARFDMYDLQPDEVWGNSTKKIRRGIWKCLMHPDARDVDHESAYRSFFPKTFNSTGDCYDPTSIGIALWEVGLSKVDKQDRSSLAALSADTWADIKKELGSFDWRTYFLDPTCADMIHRSHLDDSLELSELLFSMPAFVVSLPKSLVIASKDQHGNHDPVIALAVSRTFTVCHTGGNHNALRQDALSSLGVDIKDIKSLNKRIVSEGDGTWKEIRDSWIDEFGLAEYQDEVTLAPVINIGGVTLNGNNMPIRFPLLDKSIRSSLDFLTDHAFVEFGDESGANEALELTRFTLKLLLFLAAKPEEVELEGKEVRRIRHRRGKLMNDSKWSPCFIGRKYGSSMKEKGYGERGKVSSHWRRGHFRGYWTGKGRTKQIVKWVDPCYVNDPNKDRGLTK